MRKGGFMYSVRRNNSDEEPAVRNNRVIFPRSIGTFAAVLVVIVGAIYFLTNYSPFSVEKKYYDSEWQAIFLTTGQVYFGKIAKMDNENIYFENIYYIQVESDQNALAQDTEEQKQPEQQLQLIKLGKELHGPQDAMLINRRHVVMIEELSENSRVVQAIDDYNRNAR